MFFSLKIVELKRERIQISRNRTGTYRPGKSRVG